MPRRRNKADNSMEETIRKVIRLDKNSIIELISSVIAEKVKKAKGSAVSISSRDLFHKLIGRSRVIGYVAYRSVFIYFLKQLATKGYLLITKTRYFLLFTIPKRLNNSTPNPLFSTDSILIAVFLRRVLSDI